MENSNTHLCLEQQLRSCAELAKLAPTESEMSRILTELEQFLIYADILKNKNVASSTPAIVSSPSLRSDISETICSEENLISNEITNDKGYIEVPRVII